MCVTLMGSHSISGCLTKLSQGVDFSKSWWDVILFQIIKSNTGYCASTLLATFDTSISPKSYQKELRHCCLCTFMGGVGLAYNSAIFDKEIYPKLFSSGVSLFSVETWKDFFSYVVYVYLSIYLIKGRFVHVALFVSKVMHKLSLEIETVTLSMK